MAFFIVTEVKTSNLTNRKRLPKFISRTSEAETMKTSYWAPESPSAQMMSIWGFHGGDYVECLVLGCCAVWLLLRTDVSEERSASIIRVKRISELRRAIAITNNWSTQGSTLTFFLVRWFLSVWWWERYVPMNIQFLQEPRGATFQEKVFILVESCTHIVVALLGPSRQNPSW
jgi:hypothetical protein